MKTVADFDPRFVNNFQPLLADLSSIDWDELAKEGQRIIYMITDPRPSVITTYVGQTTNQRRISEHIAEAKRKEIDWPSFSKPKRSWLRELINMGLQPKVDVLQVVDASDADYVELLWIGLIEHSPFHILVNGLDTRAVGASLVPLDTNVPAFNLSGHSYAKIDALQEYWLGHWRKVEGYSGEGNCLLRCEQVAIGDPAFIDRLTSMTIREYYAEVLGAENLNNIVVGMKKAYRRSDIKTTGPCTIEVRFSTYIPWVYQNKGIPPALRQD